MVDEVLQRQVSPLAMKRVRRGLLGAFAHISIDHVIE